MEILEKVLLAQDFDESSKNVTNAAIELGKVFHSKIVPIHVIPDDIINDKVKNLVRQAVVSKLEETVKHIEAQGIEVDQPILQNGPAYEVIVKTGASINTNLILTGSGENRKEALFQLGTTTERIIQNSEKPVFVVKENVPLNVKTILCPVDFSDASKRALHNAIIMARRFNAKLIVFSVCELQTTSWFSSKEELEKENNIRCEQHQKEFNTFIKLFNLTDLDYSLETAKGIPADEILACIENKGIDLLVMGTAGRTGLNRLVMGSVTEKVIREVPCSFLTLKSEDVINLQLQTDIKDFEMLYEAGSQLDKDGFYEEAIEQFKACLSINIMHVPAYEAIAKVFDKLNAPEKAKLYRKSAREIKDRIWYSKIEDEVRKLRGS